MALFSRRTVPSPDAHRTAIIDIGSNSIRLVVYAGPRRIPATIFNEKVMAGLGQSLADTGALQPEAMHRALDALRRFRLLLDEMRVDEVTCVATAAVREATNGAEFAAMVQQLGLDLSTLSGEEEAEVAAMGVLSAIPEADGIVGDLGGGSLDLARVEGGQVHERATLPLGVLRLAAMQRGKSGSLARALRTMLGKHKWLAAYPDRAFYLVGGSWRAVARLDMHLTGYPLRVLHHYEMPPSRPERLAQRLVAADRAALRGIDGLQPSRIETLDDAVALLRGIVGVVRPSRLITSSYGLREGLLYRALGPDERQRDPLLVAVKRFGESQSRFREPSEPLYDWISPIFAGDPPEWRRWLLAACHLADVAWQANPDFRAERGLEIALHGNWVGIDAVGRSMIGQALFTNFGGGVKPFPIDRHVADPAMLERATAWGLALRLAHRLAAGTHGIFGRSSLSLTDSGLVLTLPNAERALIGEVVDRRLRRLGQALAAESKVVLTD